MAYGAEDGGGVDGGQPPPEAEGEASSHLSKARLTLE